jgi:hypothetical protein
MPYTPKTPAERITETLARLAPLDGLAELVADYRAAEIRHARTYRDSDEVDVCQIEDEIACLLERAFGWDLTDVRAGISDNAWGCGFDLREGVRINRNGDHAWGYQLEAMAARDGVA